MRPHLSICVRPFQCTNKKSIDFSYMKYGEPAIKTFPERFRSIKTANYSAATARLACRIGYKRQCCVCGVFAGWLAADCVARDTLSGNRSQCACGRRSSFRSSALFSHIKYLELLAAAAALRRCWQHVAEWRCAQHRVNIVLNVLSCVRVCVYL